MRRVNIGFKGMSFAQNDCAVEDGTLALMHNAKFENGEVVPVNKHVLTSTNVSDYRVKMAKFHGDRLLELFSDGSLGWAKNYRYDKTGHEFWFPGSYDKFEVLGNVVTMYGTYDGKEGVFYAIWRKDKYVFLGALPDVPEPEYAFSNSCGVSRIEGAVYKQEGTLSVSEAMTGGFEKCLDSLYNDTCYIGCALFMVGIRLFDGSYIYTTPKLFVDNKDFDTGKAATMNGIDKNFIGILASAIGIEQVYVDAAVLGFKIDCTFDYDFGKWADVIASIDLFSSGSIMRHKKMLIDYYNITMTDGGTVGIGTRPTGLIEIYGQKSIQDIIDAIENCSDYYRVARFDLKGKKTWSIENTSPSNLAVQEKLPYRSVKKYVADKSFVYNARMHITAKKELPLKMSASTPFDVFGEKDTSVSSVNIEQVLVKNGKAVYKQSDENISLFKTGTNLVCVPKLDISKYMSHVSYRDSNKVERNRYYEVELKNHPLLEMSQAVMKINPLNYNIRINSFLPLNNVESSRFDTPFNTAKIDVVKFRDKVVAEENIKSRYVFRCGAKIINGIQTTSWSLIDGFTAQTVTMADYGITVPGGLNGVIDFYNYGGTVVVELENKSAYYKFANITSSASDNNQDDLEVAEEEDKNNILMVSDLDNPFYFPNSQKYYFDNEILGMAANLSPVSTGQFGQYPLYVFTKGGVWSMAADSSGATAYLTKAPICGDICTGGICPTPYGVVFSVERGIKIIQGGDVAELSDAVDSDYIFIPKVESLLLDGHKTIYGIREYCKKIILGYDYLSDVVIVCNPDFNNVLEYSVKTQTWHVRGGVREDDYIKFFAKVDNLSPFGEQLLYAGTKRFFYNGYSDTEPVRDEDKVVIPIELEQFFLITRPIKAGNLDYKRLRQAALRCRYKGTVNLYVLASCDGIKWVCIAGKETSFDDWHTDIITAMNRSRQYRFFAIAVDGLISGGGVSFAELIVDDGFVNNRLR